MRIKLMVIAVILIITAMMLYPPFIIIRNGSEINMGYSFLLEPPSRAVVNISLLVTQWLFVLLISAPILFFLKKNNSSVSTQNYGKKPLFLRKAIILSLHALRITIGLIFVWQILGLIPIYSWLGNLSGVTEDMLIAVAIKIIVMIIALFSYKWCKRYINVLSDRYLLEPL